MSARSSTIYMDDDEFEELDPYSPIHPPSPRRHDFLQQEARWERQDHARQMVRYHDQNHYGADQRRRDSKHLEVPMDQNYPRRPRARSDTRTGARNYLTQEIRPEPRPSNDCGDADMLLAEGERHKILPIHGRGSIQTKTAIERPIIRVDSNPLKNTRAPPMVIQPNPPQPSLGHTPRSPNGEPKLRYNYLLLQNTLADVRESCRRFVDVEPSSPQDLTFAKINEQVKAFEFDLEVWHQIANVDHVPRTNLQMDALKIANAASRSLDRLTDRATELKEACAKAKPGDLKFVGLPQLDDETELFDDEHDDDDGTELDPMESLGFIIDSSLHSIELQLQSLKRLIRSLQETTPEAKEEMDAVAGLVDETVRYFGSEDAQRRYPVDEKYAGRRALNEAKYAAAR